MEAKSLTVFGWRVHRYTLDANEEFYMDYREDMRAENSTTWTLWTQGGFDMVSIPDAAQGIFPMWRRLRGHVTKRDLAGTIIAAGAYRYRVFEPSEMWCINYDVNKGFLPKLESVILAKGEAYAPPVGTLLLVARGITDAGAAPIAISVVTPGKEIVALEDTALIIFDRRK